MANVTYIAPVKAENEIHKIRCAAYCRVSSSSEDQLHSYAAQVKYYGEKFNGSDTEELVDIYADEGITGTSTDKRTEFQRLIRDCKRGKIDRVYAKSLSRFARNTKDCLKTVRVFRELGITIFFEKENIDTAKTNDELMITVMSGLAQEESTSISQNMRWSIKKRMEKGAFKQSLPPFGYTIINGKLAVDNTNSLIVKQIFSWYLSGKGLRQIAIDLNDKYGKKGDKNITWSHRIVRYILTNEKYTGDSLFEKSFKTESIPSKKIMNKGERDSYYISGTHEAIISKTDFEMVQSLLAGVSMKYKRCIGEENIFGKIIKCSNCGSSFKRKCNNGIYYWTCIKHDYQADNCQSKPVRE